jgi:hypothetical protein
MAKTRLIIGKSMSEELISLISSGFAQSEHKGIRVNTDDVIWDNIIDSVWAATDFEVGELIWNTFNVNLSLS